MCVVKNSENGPETAITLHIRTGTKPICTRHGPDPFYSKVYKIFLRCTFNLNGSGCICDEQNAM